MYSSDVFHNVVVVVQIATYDVSSWYNDIIQCVVWLYLCSNVLIENILYVFELNNWFYQKAIALTFVVN